MPLNNINIETVDETDKEEEEQQGKDYNDTSPRENTISKHEERNLKCSVNEYPGATSEEGLQLRSGTIVERVLTAKELVDKIVNHEREEFYFLTKHMEELHFGKDKQNPVQDRQDDFLPTCFQEAWHHPNPVERKRWREAIRTDF